MFDKVGAADALSILRYISLMFADIQDISQLQILNTGPVKLVPIRANP